jgi:hypothetical protein
MIFRLGGLGLICMFGGFWALQWSPVLMLGIFLAYPLLAWLAIWHWKNHRPSDPGPLSPWPESTQQSRRIIFAGFAISATLVAYGITTKSPAVGGLGIWLLGLCIGILALLVTVGCVRYGYFPDTPKGRGVDRVADPVQFWFLVVFFGFIGCYTIYRLAKPFLFG